MTMTSSSLPPWQSTWNKAQGHFKSARQSIEAISPPHSRILRVGKLDAEQLDQQLTYLLQEPLTKALELVNASLKARFEPELTLFIQLALYKLSIWNSGTSYGARLQDLKYTSSRFSTGPQSPSGLPRRILILHGTLTIIIPYLHTRVRTYALTRAWPDAPSGDQRHKAWDVLTKIESTYSTLGLLNFVLFIWDGRYRTIADRLLGLTLTPTRRIVRRDVSYEFMNRQMVWHAFTEFLLFLLPFITARSVRRRFKRMMSTFASFFSTPDSSRPAHKSFKERGRYYSLPLDQCAICAEDASYTLDLSKPDNIFTSYSAIADARLRDSDSPEPTGSDEHDEPVGFQITTPYVTSCGHVYCYHCIAQRMLRVADDDASEGRWECLRCGTQVESANRVTWSLERSTSLGKIADADDLDMGGGSELDLSESVGTLASDDAL